MSNIQKSANNRQDLSGRIFGLLKVVEYAFTKNKRAHWKCECSCGRDYIANGKYLACGDTKSCGCLLPKVISKRNLTHGESRGMKTKEYRTWKGMKTRCYSVTHHKYPIYGGRGIVMCDRWRNSYESFLSDIGRAPSSVHSIDRIDVNGNYEPGNCKWATPKEQANNTTRSVFIEFMGVTKKLSEWCEEMNIGYHLVHGRLRKGWPVEKSLSTPSRNEGKRPRFISGS